MPEELPVQPAHDVAGTPLANVSSDAEESTQNVEGDDRENHRQGIFDERFSALMDGFGAACEANNIELAVAIAIHPDEQNPLVFMRGSLYENATLLAHFLRILKRKIREELEC
jgi:hypothetical protein